MSKICYRPSRSKFASQPVKRPHGAVGRTNCDMGREMSLCRQIVYEFGHDGGMPHNFGTGEVDTGRFQLPHCPDCGHPHYARSCRRCGSRRAAR